VRLKTDISTQTPLKPGTTRTTLRFAWLPIFISGCWIWLERYEVLEGYMRFQYPVTVNDKQLIATVDNWILLSKRIRT